MSGAGEPARAGGRPGWPDKGIAQAWEYLPEVLAALGLARSTARVGRQPAPATGRSPDFTQLVAGLTGEDLDVLLEVIATRALLDTAYPYVHVDVLAARRAEAHGQHDVVTATGVTAGGDFEPLGYSAGDASEGRFWEEFILGLVARGLHGVHVVGSPDSEGCRTALRRTIPEAQWRPAGPISDLSLAEALAIVAECDLGAT